MRGTGRAKSVARLGGSKRKLKLAGDMQPSNLAGASFKKNAKQTAHKKV